MRHGLLALHPGEGPAQLERVQGLLLARQDLEAVGVDGAEVEESIERRSSRRASARCRGAS